MLEKVCDNITAGAMGKIIKDTIHANGIDIGIYTQDFENEFISLTWILPDIRAMSQRRLFKTG